MPCSICAYSTCGCAQESEETKASLSALIESSTSIIESIRSQFSPEQIGISFNGGKDSVLMVELLIAVLGVDFVSQCVTFVLDEPDEFEEMIEFRELYLKSRLPNTTIFHASARDGLRSGLEIVKKHTKIDAVFLGTRCDDPSGKYQSGPCAPTTNGWPPMLRACPLFYWSFKDVWKYTLAEGVPCCSLYKNGYSSLGPRSATSKNPSLCNADGSFLPAWSLSCGKMERCGRGLPTDISKQEKESPNDVPL